MKMSNMNRMLYEQGRMNQLRNRTNSSSNNDNNNDIFNQNYNSFMDINTNSQPMSRSITMTSK